MVGSIAFSMAGYSFVAAQNITETPPTGNLTAPGNATTDATGATGTGNVIGVDNQTATATDATDGETNATWTAAGSEVNTFYVRGQIASVISDPAAAGDNATVEVVGGRLSIDVIDGEVRRVEINMTMSKPDGSDFHTVLMDNFTAGTDGTTISNATGDGNMTAADGGNTTATSAGNETTVESFLQVITGGNQTGNATTDTDNVIPDTGTENTTASAAGGNVTGNQTATTTTTSPLAENATTPAGAGNETALAQANLSQDGTFEISGSANFYLDGNLQWENVPVTIESSGRVITINVDHDLTENHFMGMPIYGFVTALIGEVNGQRQSLMPPVGAAEEPIVPPPEAPAAPVAPNATGNATTQAPPAAGGNVTGNQTATTTTTSPLAENATGNQTAGPTDNQTTATTTPPASTAGASGGGGGNIIEVSITPGSTSKTDDAYDPNPVQASVGDTVRWTNDDTTPHTVTSGANAVPDGKFDSSPNLNPLLAPGQIFEHTFEEAGEYPYYCAVHPNMVGTVSVS